MHADQPDNLLSISIVLYRSDLVVLEKVLMTLNGAAGQLAAPENRPLHLTLVDHSVSKQYSRDAQTLLARLPLHHLHYTYVVSPKNTGYGAGNNTALLKTSARYHLVLNPDVYLYPDSLEQAVNFLEAHPKVGLLAPAVFGDNGEQHRLCRTNPTPWLQFLRAFAPPFMKKQFETQLNEHIYLDHDYNQPIFHVPFLSGCCLFFRTGKARAIKGFDERFFLYMEDADVTRRMLAVAETAYVPTVKATHLWERGAYKWLYFRWLAVKASLTYWWIWKAAQSSR